MSRPARTRRTAAVVLAGVLVATAAAIPALLSSGTAQAATTTGGVKFAYFTQWGIYANAFYPKNLDTEGIAGKLDYLVYAFENIDPTNKTCFEADSAASQDENNPNAGDGAGDSFADYGKSYGADISVDGVADTFNQPIVGNFNQLKKLKAKYPNLKILVSIGGWTYSKYFSDAAATDASRKKFVSSCIDMFIKGNLPLAQRLRRRGYRAGIFDGVDIDWEYVGRARRTPATTSPRPTAELHRAAGRVPHRAGRGGRRQEVPDRRRTGRPGQDHARRDQQDRSVPRLRQRHDLRHARRLGGHRPDQPAGPALQLAERPDDPGPAGHRQVLHRLGGQGVDRR